MRLMGIVGVIIVKGGCRVCGGDVALVGGFGAIGGRISRRRVGRPATNVRGPVVGCCGSSPKYANRLIFSSRGSRHRPGGTAVRELDGAFARGGLVVVAGSTAGFRHGQPHATSTTGQVGGRLSTGRGGAPATVPRGIVAGLGWRVIVGTSDGRQGGIVVGVEAILLHFFPTLLLGRFLALPLAEQPDGDENENGN